MFSVCSGASFKSVISDSNGDLSEKEFKDELFFLRQTATIIADHFFSSSLMQLQKEFALQILATCRQGRSRDFLKSPVSKGNINQVKIIRMEC